MRYQTLDYVEFFISFFIKLSFFYFQSHISTKKKKNSLERGKLKKINTLPTKNKNKSKTVDVEVENKREEDEDEDGEEMEECRVRMGKAQGNDHGRDSIENSNMKGEGINR